VESRPALTGRQRPPRAYPAGRRWESWPPAS